jgi:membrane protease YdiL (CAAX protease family)
VPAWNALLSSWDAWLLTLVLAVGVPTLAYFRFRGRQKETRGVFSRRAKLTLYFKTICWQWSLVAAMLLVARRHGLSAGEVGERLGDVRLTSAVTAGLLAIVAVVYLIMRWLLGRARPKAAAAAGDGMRQLVPASGPEMAVFVFLSLTAGICEELLYRGWLVNILRVATGSVWAAVGVSSAMFGLGHAYQGAKGMLRTTFVGLQLALLFVYVNSLIPGQVLHAAVDIIIGLLMATAASRTSAAEAQPGNHPPPQNLKVY